MTDSIDHHIQARDGGLMMVWRREQERGLWECQIQWLTSGQSMSWGPLPEWHCASLQSVMRRMVKFYDCNDIYNNVGKSFIWKARTDDRLTGWKVLRRMGRSASGAPLYLVSTPIEEREFGRDRDFFLCPHEEMTQLT